MMRRLLIGMLVAASIAVGTAQPAAALEVVRLGDLIAYPPARTGEAVVIEGEAIGQALNNGRDHVFVNVLDDATAVGVYMTEEQSAVITGYGDYKHTGTFVRVTGVLNVACGQHGGDFDIHAVKVSLLKATEGREPEPLGFRLIFAPVALAFGLGQLLLYRRLRGRRHMG